VDPPADPHNPAGAAPNGAAHLSHLALTEALTEAREAVHRPDFRRAVVCGLLAVAAPPVAYWLGWPHPPDTGRQIGCGLAIFACALFGLIAVRSGANEVARLVRPRGGPSVAGVLRLLITVIGYTVVLITVLDMVVSIKQLLVSGAITGVIVGIAAQQSLGNAFAGLVLLFSRPFSVGDTITLRSGALGGPYDGEVSAITLMYTVLLTAEGPVSLPNSGVLAAATGRRAPLSARAPAPVDEQGHQADPGGEAEDCRQEPDEQQRGQR
jgi:small-conductance mechanosensitive channel